MDAEGIAVDDAAERSRIDAAAWNLIVEAHQAEVQARCAPYQQARSSFLFRLLLLNIVLQIFDGVATCSGLHLGIREANPLLRGAFHTWGVVPTVLFFKVNACVLLLFVYRFASERIVMPALSVLACAYSIGSLIPWLAAFVAVVFRFS
jgi:Domain of unknown function (DUF5658)